jgi:hypothetical protein
MTEPTGKRAEERKKEIEGEVNQMIEDTIKESWAPNTLAFLAVVVGSFVLNLLVLLLISGG